MQLGDIYRVTPACVPTAEKRSTRRMNGKVVYVHPLGRYAILEFEGIWNSFREGFFPEQLTQKNLVRSGSGRK